MDIWLTKSRGRQFVGVLCPCVENASCDTLQAATDSRMRLSAHIEMSPECRWCIGPLPPSLSVCYYTQMSVFQRASNLLPQHSKHGEILRCCHRQTSSDVCVTTGDSRRHNAITHVCTLDAWLTTITVHYTVNALSAGELALFSTSNVLFLFTLFCTRQLLLNSVYLHLSAIYLDCLFNFTFFS